MKNFTYYRPSSTLQAVELLEKQWGNAELLAGGTDLHDLQKEYVAQPTKVISLGGIAALSGIEVTDGQIKIGAGTTLAAIASHTAIRTRYPALSTAAGEIGGPQIRNVGTLGGNLCQRNRCWYFRDEHVHCLLKGGKTCFATNGEHQYHAIFTKGHRCIIVNPSTLAPVLIALGASAEVRGPTGTRTLELAKFFHAPNSATEREHVLQPNELLLSVTIPSKGLVNASYEVRHKQSYDWPLVQAAVAFDYNRKKRTATGVRVVLGHVSPIPHVASAAAKVLEGQEVTEARATTSGRAASEGASPLSQNGYKVKLVEVAVKRAILTATGAARYWEV
jgi:xanthine dehydrogenase YagS FAD-binding subunit